LLQGAWQLLAACVRNGKHTENEGSMDATVLQRLKEAIGQQKDNLTTWLMGSRDEERAIRLGPLGEEALHDHVHTLESALTKAENNTLGLCEVCHEFVESSRLEMDYTASVCLEHLTGEERSRLENDLELSQKVQRALLPHSVPSVGGLEIAAFSQPARIVGGDYFDFLRFKDGSHAFVVADVMGKGMPASMLMASLQASLRIIAPESTEPADVLTRLNFLFCHNIRLTKFVTMFLARFNERTREFTYANAGHNPPLLRRRSGIVQSLRPTGAAIGLAEQSHFQQQTITLQEGDQLLMYTDGVVESANPAKEEFGEQRLEGVVQENAGRSPQQLIASLKEHLQQFSGATTPDDDTTIIAINSAG
jgi:RNA polymerase-binding transcription factor DksA